MHPHIIYLLHHNQVHRNFWPISCLPLAISGYSVNRKILLYMYNLCNTKTFDNQHNCTRSTVNTKL